MMFGLQMTILRDIVMIGLSGDLIRLDLHIDIIILRIRCLMQFRKCFCNMIVWLIRLITLLLTLL